MAYILESTSTRPSGATWFIDAGPTQVGIVSDIKSWVNVQNGFIKGARHIVSKDCVQTLYIFDTQTNADIFKAAYDVNADVIIRDTYNQANNIVEVWSNIP
jgi:hypothetical protein